MSWHADTDLDTGLPREKPPDEAGGARSLLLMRAGGRAFAVFADESDGVAEGLRPTPLPHAPRAVLGLVCVRGRMRTVLDPVALLDASDESQTPAAGEVGAAGGVAHEQPRDARHTEASERRMFVALRGDEQLALAVESVGGVVQAHARELAPPRAPAHPSRGSLEHEGERVELLDPSRLFEAATRGTDRRRKRITDK